MAIQWSEFRNVPDVRKPGQMRVSINAAGVFTLNRIAWETLGEPDAAVLLYDEYNRVIGLKPAHPRIENAVLVRKWDSKGGRFAVRAIALCVHLGITIGRTLIFRNPTIEDGVMVLALRDTYEFTSRRKNYESCE